MKLFEIDHYAGCKLKEARRSKEEEMWKRTGQILVSSSRFLSTLFVGCRKRKHEDVVNVEARRTRRSNVLYKK